MSKKEQIKEILKPHFGYLNLYLKWDIDIETVREFHEFVKDNKDLIRKLPRNLNEYSTYLEVRLDILNLQDDINVSRIFKDGLNGTARKFFKETFEKYKSVYFKISEDKFKLDMFFRNSSKPKNKSQFIQYLISVHKFDPSMEKLIDLVEKKANYIRLNSGGYMFRLTPDMTEELKYVPSVWCIKDSPEVLESYSMVYNSVWLVVDPTNMDPNKRMVGIDVEKDKRSILYMDIMNNRFTKNPPITIHEFFKLTRSRLPSNLDKIKKLDPTSKMNFEQTMNKLINDYELFYEKEHQKIEQEEEQLYESEEYKRLLRIYGKD